MHMIVHEPHRDELEILTVHLVNFQFVWAKKNYSMFNDPRIRPNMSAVVVGSMSDTMCFCSLVINSSIIHVLNKCHEGCSS